MERGIHLDFMVVKKRMLKSKETLMKEHMGPGHQLHTHTTYTKEEQVILKQI